MWYAVRFGTGRPATAAANPAPESANPGQVEAAGPFLALFPQEEQAEDEGRAATRH